MFYYLNGIVIVMEANLAVVDCGGVGFACNTTGYTLSQLQIGKQHKLFTYCNVREDAFDIFGFSTKEELDCFQKLIGVSGVGPKAGLAILSVLTPSQFTLAVMTGDEKSLTMAQGVGKKMAQRIILELKDKLSGDTSAATGASVAAAIPAMSGNKVAEASAALASLGYSQSEISRALKGLDAENLTVEEIVRHGLRAMVMQ